MNLKTDHLNHRWIITSEFFEFNLDYKKDLEHYKSILKQIERDIKLRKLLESHK